jgi:hypothetical protein
MARPNKKAKYTKIIPIRFTPEQWLNIQIKANKEKQEPSPWIRKKILDLLNGR